MRHPPNQTCQTRTGAKNRSPVHCYAVRRVNPFRGVYQIIDTAAGRAISANGVVWDIEVCTENSDMSCGSGEAAYIRYGLWSVDDGLVSRPLAPSMGGDEQSALCRQIIAAIEDSIERLPFDLEDRHELWLFDSDRQSPIALLESRLPGQKPISPEPRYWKGSVGLQGVPSQHRFHHCDRLEEMVRERAGFNVHKCWFERGPDGSGRFDHSDEMIEEGRFPIFLLSESWPENEQASLVRDYINWISPSLLTLQNLSETQRQRLEENLHVQAISVEHHWRLYPRVLDGKRLKSARVQGRLQQI